MESISILNDRLLNDLEGKIMVFLVGELFSLMISMRSVK